MRKGTRPTLLLLAAASVCAGWWMHPATATAQDAPASDVPQLRATLTDPQSKPEQRDIAASRLLSRTDPAARTAIREALGNVQQPAVQLAAARALAANPVADPNLVEPLFALFDANSSKPLIDAAAHALTVYKDQPEVLTRLLALARNADERVRLAAIRAAGTFMEKRVAQTMLDLMDPTAQQPSVNQAAGDALAYMTGLDPTNDLDRWRAWWQQRRDMNDQQFRLDLSRSRAQRYDEAHATVNDLQDELWRVLNDQYQRTQREQRADLLLRLLRSTQPTVRSIGASITAEAAKAGSTPPQVIEQIRGLIGDSSADVRKQVAIALSLINDADSLIPLLTQLNQEPDSVVRAAIAQALRPIVDVRSVRPLLTLLEDPRQETAQAAAAALSEPELGARLRKENPALADEAADKLWKALVARTTAQNNTDLRYDIIRAITPLQSKAIGKELTRLAGNRAEVPKVRRALAAALGEMHDPQFAGAIADMLDDADPAVRLEALRSLGKSDVAFGDFERRLSDRMSPEKETSPEVREEAWKVLNDLFKKAPTTQLAFWVDKLKGDPVRQIKVLEILRDRARASGDSETVAARNHQIGDASAAADMWEAAIEPYTAALAFNASAGRAPSEQLISESLMKALLRARKYEDAIKFAEQQIAKDPKFNELGNIVRLEVDRLINRAKEFDNARLLISLAMKMNPPLKPNQVQSLQELATELDRRSRERNLIPNPPPDPSIMAMREVKCEA